MQQPPRITLDTLLNPQQFHDSLNAVGVTAAEKQAMVVLSQLVYCRDLHQLHRASVVLLLDVSKVTSCEELVSSGAFAHGQHALRWLKKKFCCEGSPLSYKQLRLACKAGVIVGVHADPFAVDASHPQSDSALRKLRKLCSHGRQPPCNKLLDDWLPYLAQRGTGGPLFVLCGGKPYWASRPFFQAAAQQGRLHQRSEVVMQQHKLNHQFWQLTPRYYRQQDLDRFGSTVVAALAGPPLPPPAVPSTPAHHLALVLRGSSVGSAVAAAAAPAGQAARGSGTAAGAAAAAAGNTAAALPASDTAPAAAGGPSSSSQDGTLQCPHDQPHGQQPSHSNDAALPAVKPDPEAAAAAAGLAVVKPDPEAGAAPAGLPAVKPDPAAASTTAAGLAAVKPDPEAAATGGEQQMHAAAQQVIAALQARVRALEQELAEARAARVDTTAVQLAPGYTDVMLVRDVVPAGSKRARSRRGVGEDGACSEQLPASAKGVKQEPAS